MQTKETDNTAKTSEKKMQWTPQQQQAITARDGTVLVSAAAGSGKTAVLVQRVVDILTDREHPVEANRILVVTFSNAAAQEMRSRIEKRLLEMIADDPSDTYLVRQRALLSASHISTVHSFCLDLVRANFHQLDISPDFRLGSENEIKLLEEDIAQETIELNYENNDGRFSELVELVSSGRDDRKLLDVLRKLYAFVRSHPFYKEWLEEKLLMYDDSISVGDTVWGEVIRNYAVDAVDYAQKQLRRALEMIEGDSAMEKAYLSCFESDLHAFEEVRNVLQTGKWDDICRKVLTISFGKLGTLRGYEDDEKKEIVQSLRKTAKEIAEELQEKLFCVDEEGFLQDIRFLRPKIETLFSLVLDYDRRLMQAKKEKNLLDFSDLEHFAVKLLIDCENGERKKTSLAKELAESFSFVLVDEYQDTNATQDMIFESVSRSDNLFMVGDVKQSIYRFRQAMPEIFIEKCNTFSPYDGKNYPAKIVLSHNFRSRQQVAGAINYLFHMMMSRDVGEIDYDEQEELFAAAQFPEKDDCDTEVCFVENASEDLSDQRAEAHYVSCRIKKLLEEGFTVTDNATLRPIKPGDICILLRSMKNRAELYANALARQGIDVWTDTRTGFLSSTEISTTLSILRAVDNPLMDICLTAAMMSPVYGFTSDDMAVVRMKDRSSHLYLNCRKIAQGEELSAEEEKRQPLCRKLIDSFKELRRISSASPAHRLIQRLLEVTGLWDIVLAMKNGEIRQANLRLLIQYAQEYEAGGQKGISGFLRFVDRMQERGEDWSCAGSVTDSEDAVRIMSIHRSKGLEFPVVFLCDTAKKFNTQDLNSNMLLHSQLGFACCARDLQIRKQYPTVPMQALKLELTRSQLSEEMRILYVALTRAKEKLILTGVQNKLDTKLASYMMALTPQGKLSPYVVRTAASFSDWLLMSLVFHPDFFDFCREHGCVPEGVARPAFCRFVPKVCKIESEGEEAYGEDLQFSFAVQEEELSKIKNLCTDLYPDKDAREIVTKLSVSQVIERTGQQEAAFSREPAFLSGRNRQELTSAQRGTAMHTYLSCADHRHGQKNPEEEISRLLEQGYLTKAQAKSLDRKAIACYYQSELFARVSKSANVRREFPFQALLDKTELLQVLPNIGEHLVTVQGIADLIFEEEGELVLVDFKTDFVKDADILRQRYQKQLRLYAKMIEQLTHIKVKEKIIYSLCLGKELTIA